MSFFSGLRHNAAPRAIKSIDARISHVCQRFVAGQSLPDTCLPAGKEIKSHDRLGGFLFPRLF
jgi:hypothetical protein